MKNIVLTAAGLLVLACAAAPHASAAGCLRGAIAGGVIGHYAGHHGLLGAGVGCAYEHHREVKRLRQEERHDRRW